MTAADEQTPRDPELVEYGDVLTDFRGDKWTFQRWDGHKVVVTAYGSEESGYPRECTFYAGVVGIRDPRLPVEDES